MANFVPGPKMIQFLPFKVARRCWSGNDNAKLTVGRAMAAEKRLKVTVPYTVEDENLIRHALDSTGVTNGSS
jgi:hypothetical protein